MSSLLSEHAVVIAGGGPTGMMLAGELALAGVDVAIVERRPSQDIEAQRTECAGRCCFQSFRGNVKYK